MGLVPADMLPTPPESSTSPRGLLMPSPRPMLMLTTLDMVDTDTVLAMPDMAMVLATLLPMPTTERGLLMPSPRLMLLFSMELTVMVDMVLAMPDMVMLLPTPMVPSPMPMDMASKKSSAFSLIV